MIIAAESRLTKLDPLDRRLAAARPDLADIRLKAKVQAKRYVEGVDGHVCIPVADLRPRPDPDGGIDHQLLLGETVTIFDRTKGHAWVQSRASHYVGWVDADAVREGAFEATHRVAARCTHVYPETGLQHSPLRSLSAGSLVSSVSQIATDQGPFLQLDDGSLIFAGHASALDSPANDYVSEAAKFLGVPYLWGGTSGWGVDCSGLIYLAMQLCGRDMLRDSDMMAASLGEEIDADEDYANLTRGDLVFWRGHVAIVEGDGNLLHANATNMAVTREPFTQALTRIAAGFEKPIGCRRP